MFQLCPSKESSTNHRRSSKETSMFWRLAQKKLLSIIFASKSWKSYQRFCIGSSTINQSSSKKNINVLMIITLETSVTFSVCIQNFVVSSMFLKRIINESSLKEQWNMNDSEVKTSKTIKIKKVSVEIINVSKGLFKGSSMNHRRSSKETSMSPRLAQ